MNKIMIMILLSLSACASSPYAASDDEPGIGSKILHVIASGMKGMGDAGSNMQYQQSTRQGTTCIQTGQYINCN